jgi:5-dehydro-4-deoxyglucarate dehydratase
MLSPEELKSSLSGLLAFALTPFGADGAVDAAALRTEVELLLSSRCAAIFPAGGTGEFFSLSPREYKTVVETCVDQVGGRVPVVAGAGYGTSLAREFVQAAEEAGADGVLLLPPYLAEGPQRGLGEHCLAVAGSTRLGVIVYQRGATVYEPGTLQLVAEADNFVGFKDGVGDVARLQRITSALGDRLVYMNGMPTAEIHARALATCGVRTYSSAVLTFIPEIATAFAAALAAGDEVTLDSLLARAILPFAEIRARVPGYAISLVKAGARLRGAAVGSVRPPLSDPTNEDEEDLWALLAALDLDHKLATAPI